MLAEHLHCPESGLVCKSGQQNTTCKASRWAGQAQHPPCFDLLWLPGSKSISRGTMRYAATLTCHKHGWTQYSHCMPSQSASCFRQGVAAAGAYLAPQRCIPGAVKARVRTMPNLMDVCTLHARQGWHQELRAAIAFCLCDADCCQRLGQGLLLCRQGMQVSASEGLSHYAEGQTFTLHQADDANITKLSSGDFWEAPGSRVSHEQHSHVPVSTRSMESIRGSAPPGRACMQSTSAGEPAPMLLAS